jgi:hypothetical protein
MMETCLHTVSGGCYCGNIVVELKLTFDPDICHPRACDCDFCRMHGAAYVSDPNGTLTIRVEDQRALGKFRQGASLADFLLCRTCGVLVGVLHRDPQGIHAAVNARALKYTTFAAEQPVSPKKLPGDDKVKRWQQIWFRNIAIHGDGP